MNKKTVIIAICLILLVFGIVLYLSYSKDKGFLSFVGDDSEMFKKEYESLNKSYASTGKKYPQVSIEEDNPIKYTNVNEIVSIFENNGDALVYFGNAKCLYCRTAIQVLLDAAKDTELDTIYYLDVLYQGDEYSKLYEFLGEEIVPNNYINAPLVIAIADGWVVSYNKGTLFNQETAFDELNESQYEGLKEIYYYSVEDVLRSIRNKKEVVEPTEEDRTLNEEKETVE